MTLEDNFGTTPEPLRQGPFCPSRLPDGSSPYEPLFWSGNLRRVESVYRPSGKVSIGHLALFVVSPLVLGMAAVWISQHLLPLLGWVTLAVDAAMAFAIFAVLFVLLRHCRNSIVSCVAAIAAMGLAAWGLLTTGMLDGDSAMSVVWPFDSAVRYSVSEIRTVEMALSVLVISAMAFFVAKDSPYCETCRKPMEMESAELQQVSPLAVLYCLLNGYLPVRLSEVGKIVDPKLFPAAKRMKEVGVRACWCRCCGGGMVNAEVRFYNTSSRRTVPSVLFYSESWTAAEIGLRRRADARVLL